MQRYRLTALFGGLLLLLAACGSTTTRASTGSQASSGKPLSDLRMTTPATTQGSDPMTNSLKGLSGKTFEITFMQDMIVHHQAAVTMAKLVPTHTTRAELITLSQNIITAQNQQITEMTTWLAQWYQEKPLSNPMSVPGMMSMMADMNKLKNLKGAAFDQQFLSMMISHHQAAVNMANLIPARTQHPQLVQLGQNIVKAQSAEIKHMQGWQQQWFKS
jgi:uncharacterized protein (DUF305 family)